MRSAKLPAMRWADRWRCSLKSASSPGRKYQPWIRMAHDYYGQAVEHSGGGLAEALSAALPERFDRRRAKSVDLPWGFARALLEAAVAAATLADEPYDVDSPSVQRAIDELIATVQRAHAVGHRVSPMG